MKPVFKIGGSDYSSLLQELAPQRNDLDADGSGRNLLDGLMYRSRIARKMKWSLKFLRLGEEEMSRLERDLNPDFVDVTLLDPADNTVKTGQYYCSAVNHGVQRYIGGETVYDGVSVNLIER